MKKTSILLVAFLCLFIATAQAKDQDAKKYSEESKLTMEKIASHLEFLGYRIQKKPDAEKSKPYFLAFHSVYNNLVVMEIAPNIYQFSTLLKCEKPVSAEMSDFANKANTVMEISRFCFEPDDETKGTSLYFNSVYIGEYAKPIFGVFLDMFRRDQDKIRAMDNYEDIFLKKN